MGHIASATLHGALAAALLGLALVVSAPVAAAGNLDGITIARLSGGEVVDRLGNSEMFVLFVAARGIYAATIPGRGGHGGCQSLAVDGSYTGTSAKFGFAADEAVRKQRLQTYCPVFTVHLDGDALRIEVEEGGVATAEVISRVALDPIDFDAPPFTTHDVRGVRLGPVTDPDLLNPLSAPGYSSPRSRRFTKSPDLPTGLTLEKARKAQGKAAAAEITGLSWDVLYTFQYSETFPQTSTMEAYGEALRQRYGAASVAPGDWGYRFWAFELDGSQVDFDDGVEGACERTLDFWLQRDPIGRPTGLRWEWNFHDVGPWGCGLVLEIKPNTSSAGVTGFHAQAFSGVVWAVNLLNQRIDGTRELLEKVRALADRKVKL